MESPATQIQLRTAVE